MAGEFVGGAALGTAFGLLFDAVKEMKDKAVMFKPLLDDLDLTLQALEPLITEIQQLNKELHIYHLRKPQSLSWKMKKGKDLVSKCDQVQGVRDNKKNLKLTSAMHAKVMGNGATSASTSSFRSVDS